MNGPARDRQADARTAGTRRQERNCAVITGPPLSFGAWSMIATDRDGVWTGRNLPPKSIRVLVLPAAAATSSAFDAIAQRVDYPWPASITVPVGR